MVGEIYAYDQPRFSIMADSKYWVVFNVTRYAVDTYLLGTGGLTHEKVIIENWFEMIARSELKFVRYAPY